MRGREDTSVEALAKLKPSSGRWPRHRRQRAGLNDGPALVVTSLAYAKANGLPAARSPATPPRWGAEGSLFRAIFAVQNLMKRRDQDLRLRPHRGNEAFAVQRSDGARWLGFRQGEWNGGAIALAIRSVRAVPVC